MLSNEKVNQQFKYYYNKHTMASRKPSEVPLLDREESGSTSNAAVVVGDNSLSVQQQSETTTSAANNNTTITCAEATSTSGKLLSYKL